MKIVCIVPVLLLVTIFLNGCATPQVANVQKEKVMDLNAYATPQVANVQKEKVMDLNAYAAVKSMPQSGEAQVVEKNDLNVREVNQAVSGGLSDIKIYPIPWQPNSGGRLGSASKPCGTGLIIDGFTNSARVRVYDIQADLVWEKNTSMMDKCVAWDGRNLSGRNVASGIYTIIISNATGKSMKRNVAIER